MRSEVLAGHLLLLWAGWSGIAAELPSPDLIDPAASLRGRQLARTYCVTCHLFPEPDALERATWREEILPRMKYRLGFSTPQLEQSPNIKILRAHHRIPAAPVISEAQWVDLVAYYLKESPAQALGQDAYDPIQVGVPGFRVTRLPLRAESPSATAVKILPGGGALIAEDGSQSITWMGRDGDFLQRLAVSNSVAGFRVHTNGILTALLGNFLPSDAPRGGVSWLTRPSAWQLESPILSGLPRTTDAQTADLNGDARPDWIVSCFGNNIGRLSWWENRADGRPVEHELFGLPGVLRTELADFNGDGQFDIAALVAQETEAILLFIGDGRGGFARKTVIQRPPYWGHSSFELADFNQDGRPDFLVTNGDNGEFSAASKRYHGVRIYLSQPGGDWREASFFPMYGAYKAMARDFDGDGDLDIAAVSFFPDYQRAPRGTFLFLRNEGRQRFKAFTFAESALGRWLTLDAGDFDADGDDDILLGSYIKGPTPVPAVLFKAWQQEAQPLMLLKNLLRTDPTPGE